MKNILFILTIVFSSIMYSQEITPKSGDNILDPYADKFLGTWVWREGNDSFKIILKKENILVPLLNNVKADWIIGFHKFVKNGTIIEDTSLYTSTNFLDKKNSIISSTDSDNRNYLTGYIIHSSKNKSVKFVIQYIDATHIKIISFKNTGGLKVTLSGQPPFDWSITLPQNIILTKQ